jgi:hypothetical protein
MSMLAKLYRIIPNFLSAWRAHSGEWPLRRPESDEIGKSPHNTENNYEWKKERRGRKAK